MLSEWLIRLSAGVGQYDDILWDLGQTLEEMQVAGARGWADSVASEKHRTVIAMCLDGVGGCAHPWLHRIALPFQIGGQHSPFRSVRVCKSDNGVLRILEKWNLVRTGWCWATWASGIGPTGHKRELFFGGEEKEI